MTEILAIPRCKRSYKADFQKSVLKTEGFLNCLVVFFLELSADRAMREPYVAYMQGGLTYEYGKLGILKAINEML